MLAYVFWHSPSADADRTAYEEALTGFHASLRARPPAGFLRSLAFRSSGTGAGRTAPETYSYEDWYLVDDWQALGRLNEAAVSGPRRAPHDLVAGRTGTGAGGLYGLLRGHGELDRLSSVAWLSKPPGIGYDAFRDSLEALPPRGEVWQRQLVLGPAPEFCVDCTDPCELPWPVATRVDRVPLARA